MTDKDKMIDEITKQIAMGDMLWSNTKGTESYWRFIARQVFNAGIRPKEGFECEAYPYDDYMKYRVKPKQFEEKS